MRALRLDQGRVEVVDRSEPEAGPGDAVVAVHLAGICGTDLELLAGYKAFRGVPGHEFVGTVVASPSAPGWAGRRVVASISEGCGACAACRTAGPGHCADRRVLGILRRDGALAERVAVPVANLVAVPDGLSDLRAAFAEPVAAACRITEQVEVDGRRVVVVGAGRLGLLVALVLRAHGAEVTAVARGARSQEILDRAGVPHVAACSDVPPGADVVVDTTGAAGGPEEARRLVRPRGTLVLKTTCAPAAGASALDTTALVVDEVTVVGSRCGPLDAALELLATGAVDPEPLVDAVLPLSDGARAFALAAAPGALKVLVSPDA